MVEIVWLAWISDRGERLCDLSGPQVLSRGSCTRFALIARIAAAEGNF